MVREALDHWDFVIAAYGLGIGGTLAMVGWAWWSMRRAERKREESRRK